MVIYKAELLIEITDREALRYVDNSGYGCEEKHNGERKIVYKDADGIHTTNRDGEPSTHLLPTHVINAFRNHPLPTFVIDIEFERGVAVILDVLFLGGLDFRGQRYDKRKEASLLAFANRSPLYRVCETITGKAAKAAFILAKKAEKAEGVCFKKLDAPYKPGKNGQHLKLKFWKSLDCVVMGPNTEGHNSVEVGLYNKQGRLQRICGVSLNGKEAVRIGDVIEIDYLYGTAKLEVVQPNLVRVRDDKRPEQCTIDQIQVNKNFRRAR
jgi:bifunctional non-homologous end joining protein LigD